MTPQEAAEIMKGVEELSGDFPEDGNLVEEALSMAITALEKQVPKKVTDIHVDEYYCPSCGSENMCDQKIVCDNYCPICGQAIYQEGKG